MLRMKRPSTANREELEVYNPLVRRLNWKATLLIARTRRAQAWRQLGTEHRVYVESSGTRASMRSPMRISTAHG
jgi:hypothetical protein